MDYMEWVRMLRGVSEPRIVVLTGGAPPPAPPPDDRLGDFSALSARDWHAMVVERAFWEKHGRGDPDAARPDR